MATACRGGCEEGLVVSRGPNGEKRIDTGLVGGRCHGPRFLALLGFFIRHPGQVLTRRQILDGVWGAEPDVYSNVVDLYIHYLRRKLGELGRAGRLRTVRGVGYSLRVDG